MPVNRLLTLLNQCNFVSLTINFKSELTLRIRDLDCAIRLSHAVRKLINNPTLRIVGLTSTRLALLGLRSFLNRSLIQEALTSQITINSYLIRNLLTTRSLEDLGRNNNSALDAVLVDEGVLEISRVHTFFFLLEENKYHVGRTINPAAPRGLDYSAIWKVAEPLFFSGSMRSTLPSLTRTRRAALIFWAETPNSAAMSLLVTGSAFSASLARTSARNCSTSRLTLVLRGRAALRASWSSFFWQKATTSSS